MEASLAHHGPSWQLIHGLSWAFVALPYTVEHTTYSRFGMIGVGSGFGFLSDRLLEGKGYS